MNGQGDGLGDEIEPWARESERFCNDGELNRKELVGKISCKTSMGVRSRARQSNTMYLEDPEHNIDTSSSILSFSDCSDISSS